MIIIITLTPGRIGRSGNFANASSAWNAARSWSWRDSSGGCGGRSRTGAGTGSPSRSGRRRRAASTPRSWTASCTTTTTGRRRLCGQVEKTFELKLCSPKIQWPLKFDVCSSTSSAWMFCSPKMLTKKFVSLKVWRLVCNSLTRVFKYGFNGS
jgi:hypothetical protein